MLKDRLSRIEKAGVKVEFVLGVGSPSEEIVKITRNVKADVIVLGSRQLKHSESIVALGSVARRVSETACRPIMIIR